MKVIWIAVTSVLLAGAVSASEASDMTAVFDVQKMTCAACPISVRKAMQRVTGVKAVQVSLESESAVVTFDPNKTTVAEIGKASADVGFPATAKDGQ